MDDKGAEWKFVPVIQSGGLEVHPTLRVGDYDLDGYLDIITVIEIHNG